MAQPVEVTCITRTNHPGPHECIRAIGGWNADGTRWSLSQHDAVGGLQSGIWDFYVVLAECPIPLVVAFAPGGARYLKTLADEGFEPTTLLRLPEESEARAVASSSESFADR